MMDIVQLVDLYYWIKDYMLLLSVWIPINLLFYAGYHALLLWRSERYSGLPYHRRFYVLKNMSKSTILLCLLTYCSPKLYQAFRDDLWDSTVIHRLGTVYVSTDLTGLMLVPKLPLSTKIHHLCVLIFGFVNLRSDYQQEGLHRAMISLTYLSMIPYLVNTYLAARWLVNEKPKRRLAYMSLYIYLISVIINCGVQHYYVWTSNSLIKYLYLLLYWAILSDDFKLMKHLYDHSHRARKIIRSLPDFLLDKEGKVGATQLATNPNNKDDKTLGRKPTRRLSTGLIQRSPTWRYRIVVSNDAEKQTSKRPRFHSAT